MGGFLDDDGLPLISVVSGEGGGGLVVFGENAFAVWCTPVCVLGDACLRPRAYLRT